MDGQIELTLCNASRVGNIEHVENKISQHLKKCKYILKNKLKIILDEKRQNSSMQRILIRLDH